MKDQPNQLESQSPAESEQVSAGYLLALHDETDREAERLHRLPSAVGLLGLFLALFVVVLNSADLGVLYSLGVSLLVASPGVILIGKDFRRARRLRLLKRMIEVAEDPLVTRRGDAPRVSSDIDPIGEAPQQKPG